MTYINKLTYLTQQKAALIDEKLFKISSKSQLMEIAGNRNKNNIKIRFKCCPMHL